MSPAELTACSRILLRLQEHPGPLETPCWLWPGASNGKGYGTVKAAGRVVLVHRLLFRLLRTNPGRHRQLHHRCETPLCANPAHLEPLTLKKHRREHRDLRSVCRAGLHELTPDNLVVWKNGPNKGKRQCRACARASRGLDLPAAA